MSKAHEQVDNPGARVKVLRDLGKGQALVTPCLRPPSVQLSEPPPFPRQTRPKAFLNKTSAQIPIWATLLARGGGRGGKPLPLASSLELIFLARNWQVLWETCCVQVDPGLGWQWLLPWAPSAPGPAAARAPSVPLGA